MKTHRYTVNVVWTGNTGQGTPDYASYRRDFSAQVAGKPPVLGSADPAFRGDPARWNPEDMLLASLSACHKLWYLHLCAVNQVNVLAYEDQAEALMVEGAEGRKGHFTEAVLRPQVTISAQSDADVALRLHAAAHEECFVANSMNFAVRCEAVVRVEG